MWHRTYRTFCETTVLLLSGLELFQQCKYAVRVGQRRCLRSRVGLLTVCSRLRSYAQALAFLVHSYQSNQELLSGGLYRGHEQELLGCYRRACLLVRRGGTLQDPADLRAAAGLSSWLSFPNRS